MSTTTSVTYGKFGSRFGTQPPTVPDAPASASEALRTAVETYRSARQSWLDAEADYAMLMSDDADRATRQADADAERDRAVQGDYSDPATTARDQLEADRRAALRRVTAAQDALADALRDLELTCAGTDVAAPVNQATRTKAQKLATQLAPLAAELDAPVAAHDFALAVLASRRDRLAYVPATDPTPGPVAVALAALTDALES